MKRRLSWLVAFFSVLIFVAVSADSASARKSRSSNLHKASKSSVKKTSTGAKRSSRVTGSTKHSRRADSKKGKNSQAAVANTAEPDQQDPPSDGDDEYIRYRLKRGDSLDKVAERFNIDKDEIIDLNQVKKKGLKPGSVVLIPKAEENLEDVPVALNSRPPSAWKSAEEQGILVKVAKSFAGAPYKYGGDSVRGLDCSAFVRKMYEIFEVQLPRSAREQYCAGQRIGREDLATGDLVFFRTKRFAKYPTHVGIYIGDDKFIHASSLLSRGVKVDCLSEGYFSRTYTGAVRVKASPATNKSDAEQGSGRTSGNS